MGGGGGGAGRGDPGEHGPAGGAGAELELGLADLAVAADLVDQLVELLGDQLGAADEAERSSLDPFTRGPEITEVR